MVEFLVEKGEAGCCTMSTTIEEEEAAAVATGERQKKDVTNQMVFHLYFIGMIVYKNRCEISETLVEKVDIQQSTFELVDTEQQQSQLSFWSPINAPPARNRPHPPRFCSSWPSQDLSCVGCGSNCSGKSALRQLAFWDC